MLTKERDDWVSRVALDWRGAGLSEVDQSLCAFAEKLTRDPASMTAADVDALRRVGLDDVQVHDAVQVVSYFNYINRVADALHVDLEPEMEPYPDSDA